MVQQRKTKLKCLDTEQTESQSSILTLEVLKETLENHLSGI